MSKVITGARAGLVRMRILSDIMILAMSCLHNPVSAIKALAIILSRRRKIMGHQGVKKYIKTGNRYFFSDEVPGWPSDAFNGFFKAEIIRVSNRHGTSVPLSTIFFAITSKCPLRCKHCYEWDNISGDERLSLENLKGIINKIKNYGAYHIQLSGGEPLERLDDLLSLTDYSQAGADIWINTSGFGLSSEKAAALKKAGLTGAQISLDHWDETEHNRFRANDKSFFWVREAVKNCLEAGILTSLSLCATNAFVTEDNLKKYTDLAMEWGVSFIRLLEPKVAGRFKGEGIILTMEKVAILEEFFRNSVSRDKVPPYPLISYPGYHQRRIGCLGAGNRYLYIDSKGDIHACPFCQKPAGNAVTDQIEDAISVLKSTGCHEYKANLND